MYAQVKIGDLGLAAIVDNTHMAHTILGTPEFMALERTRRRTRSRWTSTDADCLFKLRQSSEQIRLGHCNCKLYFCSFVIFKYSGKADEALCYVLEIYLSSMLYCSKFKKIQFHMMYIQTEFRIPFHP